MFARSYSRLLALEASRILFRLGCDVRVYDPTGLPVKDDVQHSHEKVQELRDLSRWSDGHIWISPELSLPVSILLWLPRLKRCNTVDRSLQKSNRLDPSIHRQCTTDSRTHSSNRTSFWWLSVVQYGQLSSYLGSLDAHVCDSKPILNTQGLHTIYRRKRGRRRQ